MKTKRIQALADLPDERFFAELSVGMGYVLANARRIYSGAPVLEDTDNSRGPAILSILSEEEASKFLILVDAVRCPRQGQPGLAGHLRRYYDHLAKGIYGQACYWAPETFGDLVSYIDSERQRYYLDGPNDVDWIFWNQILSNREQAIYVDYVETDQGHSWICPPAHDIWAPYPNMALALAEALGKAGATSTAGLKAVAEYWRPLQFVSGTHFLELREHNWNTLKRLDALGLVSALEDAETRAILDHWPFPMHSVDLSLASLDNRPELRELQKRWQPH